MQTSNIGRFLQRALPEELESLRLVGLDRLNTKGVQAWRSYLVPINATRGTVSEFTVDILWQLDSKPAKIHFRTVARISMPESSRPWLMRKIDKHNNRKAIPLFLVEHESGRLSLSATLSGEVDAEHLQRLTARNPEMPVIESFAQSFEEASEALVLAWRDGINIGAKYRELH